MLINEVCRKCSVTKKAVEYYMEQKLISPSILENGYRDFSESDMLALQKISILRGLGISIADIRTILAKTDAKTLIEIFNKKALQITILQEKQNLISELAETNNWKETEKKLRQLEKKESILERLLNVFPGNYGRFISLHFAPYLNEPVMTEEQQEAFDTVISFLDSVNFSLPDDLQECLDEAASIFDENFVEKMSDYTREAIDDMEKYIADNREMIDSCLTYRQSEEYKKSSVSRLETALHHFSSTSGYDDIFIPAMCRLSKSYREYHKALKKADEKFLKSFPSYGRRKYE